MLQSLQKAGVVQHGQFKLKSGQTSSIYVDCRRIIGLPSLFRQVCLELALLVNEQDVAIAGVPFGGMPFAAVVAHMLRLPLILCRPTPKEHGSEQQQKNSSDVVLMEDTITTGQSVLQVAKTLESQGKRIRKVVTIVDRRPSPDRVLAGYQLTSLFLLQDLLKTPTPKVEHQLTPVCRRDMLMMISQQKQSNLIVSVDSVSPVAVLKLIDQVGAHVCAIKLHWDIYDWTEMDPAIMVKKLQQLKLRWCFLLIEDRKFGDIGMISGKQLDRIPFCFDLVTVHALAGLESIQVLDQRDSCGLLLVLQMSSSGNLLASPDYQAQASILMKSLRNLVGVVAQEKQADVLTCTPGIHLDQSADGRGQTYRTPNGSAGDFFIVGRAICESNDPTKAAELYRYACRPLRSHL